MGINWTEEQEKVIYLRNRNILVSAAAGSGKTAVLVERIFQKISDPESSVDIDRLLVLTFTNAAAAEMKNRVNERIEKALEEHPDDERLQKQNALIHTSQITTIDSFCGYIVKNHFNDINLEPNYRMGEQGELKLMEQDVLGEVFESNYKRKQNDAFLDLVDAYAYKRRDTEVRKMVLQIYRTAGSNPWPKEWIRSLAGTYLAKTKEELTNTPIIQDLLQHTRIILSDYTDLLLQYKDYAKQYAVLEKYIPILESDIELLQKGKDISDYTEMKQFFHEIQNMKNAPRITTDNEEEEARKEYLKNSRNEIKAELKKLGSDFFSMDIQDILKQNAIIAPVVSELVRLSLEYYDAIMEHKKEKRVWDFSDIEHFALNILVDEQTKETRPIAKIYQEYFDEIMIDEYQDSNYLQETILSAISKQEQGINNIFMVGDIKQSIYRFRQAKPELFMEKYNTYSIDEGDRQRIDLSRNFRSRQEVLEFVNDIFYKLMNHDLGEITYDKEAALNYGANYCQAQDTATEVLLLDTVTDIKPDVEWEDGSKREMEAYLVVKRIKELLASHMVTDKISGQLRPARLSDIVILFRSIKGWGEDFADVLNRCGIPAKVESSTGYFTTTEVQTILSFLQILDNPHQDIPMTIVLKSPIVGLDEEELAMIRLANPEMSFAGAAYEAMKQELTPKLSHFYQMYQKLRVCICDTPINEVIRFMLKETGYGHYVAAMKNGQRRQANIEMLLVKAMEYEKTSYRGLFHFVRYIEQIRKYDIDYGEADISSGEEDIVHIMTIHKSKGLEFPIVFLPGMAKQINQSDSKQKMVIHADEGMGLDEVWRNPRIKRPGLVRSIIADKMRRESLGEELRIFYVAMTRAKEKLILTSTIQKVEQTIAKYTGNQLQGQPISYKQRAFAKTYLDWIIPAMLSYPNKYAFDYYYLEDLVRDEVATTQNAVQSYMQDMEKIMNSDSEEKHILDSNFAYVYPYQSEMNKKSKYSVSELKHDSMVQMYDYEDETVEKTIPEFVKKKGKEDTNPGALRGTAMHRVMECLDFLPICNLDMTDHQAVKDYVMKQLQDMKTRGRITEEMYELVHPKKIISFVKSNLAHRMAKAQQAGVLFKEKPFVMEHEQVLVQGIIDVFWLEEDKVILLDYKTDHVREVEELKERYQTQLDLYADALSRYYSANRNKEIESEAYIYSFYFQEEVQL